MPCGQHPDGTALPLHTEQSCAHAAKGKAALVPAVRRIVLPPLGTQQGLAGIHRSGCRASIRQKHLQLTEMLVVLAQWQRSSQPPCTAASPWISALARRMLLKAGRH